MLPLLLDRHRRLVDDREHVHPGIVERVEDPQVRARKATRPWPAHLHGIAIGTPAAAGRSAGSTSSISATSSATSGAGYARRGQRVASDKLSRGARNARLSSLVAAPPGTAQDVGLVDANHFPAELAAPSSSAFFTWIGSLVRKLHRAIRVAERAAGIPEQFRFIADAMERLGPEVLGADDVQDLDDRLDVVLEREDFLELSSRTRELIMGNELAGFAAPFESPPELLDTVGAGQRALLEQIDLLADALASAWEAMLRGLSPEDIQQARELDREYDVVADHRIPVAIRRVFLSSLRMQAASLALGHAVASDAHLEPWLARALCERMRDGLLATLRLFASLPGSPVPEAIVPVAERFDLARIEAQHQAATAVADAQLTAARVSGADVFPPARHRDD